MKKETLYEYVQATYSYISIEERVKEDKTMNLIKQLVNKIKSYFYKRFIEI